MAEDGESLVRVGCVAVVNSPKPNVPSMRRECGRCGLAVWLSFATTARMDAKWPGRPIAVRCLACMAMDNEDDGEGMRYASAAEANEAQRIRHQLAVCPSPTSAGKVDRCGQFSHPPRCGFGLCTAADAVTLPK